MRRRLLLVAAVLVSAIVAFALWRARESATPAGFAVGNGRLEAQEVQIATKWPGRLATVEVEEGDLVEAGQVLARMDTLQLQAEFAAARGLDAAKALLAQRESESTLADKEFARVQALRLQHVSSEHDVDIQRSRAETAHAATRAAEAQVADATATIGAAAATVASLQTQLRVGALVAPVAGRIQHRLAEPGEVLAAGGRVLTLLDLSDVYMTLFLPAQEAGQLRSGAEARIVLDARPDHPMPAIVRFVSDEAQFTPKQLARLELAAQRSGARRPRASDPRPPAAREPGSSQ